MDIGIGVVDEHARLCITGRVDVEVVASAGNAAAHELAIVLEVHRVERDIALFRAQIADAVDHIFTLLRGRHQFGRCVVAHGHVVEVEAEVCALLTQETHELIVGNSFDIIAGVADGRAEHDAVLLEQIHSMHNSGIVPLTAAGIVGLRGALDGQHEGNVAQTHHLFAERLIDEGGVGVDGKLHIVVLLGQLEDISLTHQRLAAGQHVQVYAQLLALGNDLVHILKAEVVLVAILASPAAHAMHIAGRSGVEQDQPGDVALVLHAVFADGLGAAEESLVAQIQRHGAGHVGVGLIQHTVDELGPLAVGVGQGLSGVFVGFSAERTAIELLCDIHQLSHGFLTVFIGMRKHHVHHFANGSTLHFMSQALNRSIHYPFPPNGIFRKSLFLFLCHYSTILSHKLP